MVTGLRKGVVRRGGGVCVGEKPVCPPDCVRLVVMAVARS